MRLSRSLLCLESESDAPRRAPAWAQRSHVHTQFDNGATERVAMQAELGRRPGDVSVLFLQHNSNKGLLELADAFAVKNPASAHLQNQLFHLLFQDSLALRLNRSFAFPVVLRLRCSTEQIN